MFYRIVRRLFLMLARPCFCFAVTGRENMPPHGAVVVVARHRSWLDPPAVGAACPRPVRFLIRDRVYDRYWARWFYRRMRAVPVTPGGNRATPALREALRHLRAGGVVGVFPEGRVVPRGAADPFQAGAALLAVRGGASVLPLEIEGTTRAWPHGRKLPRPAAVRVKILRAIPPVSRSEENAVETMQGRIETALLGSREARG